MDDSKSKFKASNDENSEMSISCDEAIALIDEKDWRSGIGAESLNRHLDVCSSCRAAAAVEMGLRQVIAPAEIPQVSLEFESRLKAQLGFGLSKPKTVVFDFDNPWTFWGWIVAAMTMVGLVVSSIDIMFEFVEGTSSLIYAKMMGLLANKSMIAAGSMMGDISGMPGFNEAMALNLILGALALAGGFFAVGWTVKR